MTKQAHTALIALGTKTSVYSAGAADLTMTAADVANKEQTTLTGDELVVAHNTDSGAHTVTITSIADSNGRTGNIASYSLAAGDYVVFGPFEMDGWRQADGALYFEADSATVKFGVIRVVR